MFAITNVDDILVLALFFGETGRGRAGVLTVVIGQYAGFVAILAASVVAALGTGLLPESAVPYLGLLPLVLGLRAARTAWRERRHGASGEDQEEGPAGGPGAWQVAAVTLANGGDNIGVYVPVFAVAGAGGMTIYVAVFLLGVAVWCAAGWFFASRPVVARALSRWGHVLMPIVLIGIGALILVEGDAFGL
ncbi:MAG: cadmium resistance transporter, putative [uncultured Corynebacteriales bacterium]|uniref:Cadmium resistance transporter, putative n=1 Tax=uncultured Mycobacteriales bacterium TaxID=581187 RepID=A0A6J4IUY4_9ACTN|nr:MAG: cadmium resistance transporter, putative [uncultured Corynebacteriales bacterium]